jgi:hypothetical protein
MGEAEKRSIALLGLFQMGIVLIDLLAANIFLKQFLKMGFQLFTHETFPIKYGIFLLLLPLTWVFIAVTCSLKYPLLWGNRMNLFTGLLTIILLVLLGLSRYSIMFNGFSAIS